MEQPELQIEPVEFASGIGWYDRRVADAEVPENIKSIAGWKKAMREFMSKDARINDVVVLFTQKFVQMGQSKNFTLTTLMDLAWTVLIITWEAVVDDKLPRVVELDQGYKTRYEELQTKMFQLRESYLKEIIGARNERRRRQNPALQVAMNGLADLDDQEVFHFMPEDGLDEQTRDYFKAAMKENMKMAISRGAAAAGAEASRLARDLDVRDHECKDLTRKVDDLQAQVEALEMLQHEAPEKKDKVPPALRRSLGHVRQARSESKPPPEQSVPSLAAGAGSADLAELTKQLEASRLQEGRMKEKLNGFKAVCTYFGLDVEKIWEDLLKGLNERPTFVEGSLTPELQKSLANLGPKVQLRRFGDRGSPSEPTPAGSSTSPQGSLELNVTASPRPDHQKEEMAKQITTLQRQVQQLTKDLQAAEASKTSATAPAATAAKRPSALHVQPQKPTDARKSTGLPPPDSAGQVQRLEAKCKGLEEQVKTLQAEVAKAGKKGSPAAKTPAAKAPAAKPGGAAVAGVTAAENSENSNPGAEDPEPEPKNPEGVEEATSPNGGGGDDPKGKAAAKPKAGGAVATAAATREGGAAASATATAGVPVAATATASAAAASAAARAANKEGSGAAATTQVKPAQVKSNKPQASAPPDAAEAAASDVALNTMKKEVKTAQEANSKLEEQVAKLDTKLQKAKDKEQHLRDEIEELKEGLEHMSRMKEEVEKHLAELQSKFLDMRDKLEEKGLETRVFDETLAETGVSAMIQRVEVWKRLYSDALEERNERLERRKKRLRERQEQLERERREKEEKKLASKAHRQRVLIELSGGEAAQALANQTAESSPGRAGARGVGDAAPLASSRKGDTAPEPDASSSGSETEDTLRGTGRGHMHHFRGPCPNCGWIAAASLPQGLPAQLTMQPMQHGLASGAASGGGATPLPADSRPDTGTGSGGSGATSLSHGSRGATAASLWPVVAAQPSGPDRDRSGGGEQLRPGLDAARSPGPPHSRGQAQALGQVRQELLQTPPPDHQSSQRPPGVLASFGNHGSGDVTFSFAPFPERTARRKPTQKSNASGVSSPGGPVSAGMLSFDHARTGHGGHGHGLRTTIGHGQEDSLATMMGALQRAAGGSAGSDALRQGHNNLGHSPEAFGSRSSSAPLSWSHGKDGQQHVLGPRGVSVNKVFVQAGQQQFHNGGPGLEQTSGPSFQADTFAPEMSGRTTSSGSFQGSSLSRRRHTSTHEGASLEALRSLRRSTRRTHTFGGADIVALAAADIANQSRNVGRTLQGVLGNAQSLGLGSGPVGPSTPRSSERLDLLMRETPEQERTPSQTPAVSAEAARKSHGSGSMQPRSTGGLSVPEADNYLSEQFSSGRSRQSTPESPTPPRRREPSLLQTPGPGERRRSSSSASRYSSPGGSPVGNLSPGGSPDSIWEQSRRPSGLGQASLLPSRRATPESPGGSATPQQDRTVTRSRQADAQLRLGILGNALGSPHSRSGTASPDLPCVEPAQSQEQGSPTQELTASMDRQHSPPGLGPRPTGTGRRQSSPVQPSAGLRRASCTLPVSAGASLSAGALGLPAVQDPGGFQAMTVSVAINGSHSRGHTPPTLGSTSRPASPLRELVRVSSGGALPQLPDDADAAAAQVQSVSVLGGASPLRTGSAPMRITPGAVGPVPGGLDAGFPPEASSELRRVGNPLTLAEDIPFTAGMMVQKDSLSRSAKVPALQAPGGSTAAAGLTRHQRGWSGSPVKMKPGRLTRSDTSPALTGLSSSPGPVSSPREKLRTGKAVMANRPAVPTASHDIVVTGLVRNPT